ncbi:MAG TPA: SpoIIE family protein phosphatase [Halanaerobiales bacterium]|nr:SpoIIE family protein phosphatase [Halanaerobiales bacterium]
MNKLHDNFIQSALDSLSAHIAILDKKGIIRYTNQAWKDFAESNGLVLEECCEGTNYLKIVEDSSNAGDKKIAKNIKKIINGNKKIFSLEYPCHSPDEKRWFNMRVTPFQGEGDYKVVISHENITKRKLKSLELKKEREFNDNILNNLTEMIIYMDTDFNIQWANKAALEYNNIDFENVRGKKCFKKWDLDEACTNCPLVEAKKNKKITETIMEKPDQRIWRMKAIPDFNENGEIKGFIEVALDITKVKRAERKIKQVVNKLENQFEKAGKLHDQFLPSRTPEFEDLTIATYYSPAERLGGDFYNFIQVENHLIFYISDVSGHDLSGSMLNIFLKETINSYLISKNIPANEDLLNPANILNYINKRYSEETFPDDYFICLIIGVMDLETKNIKYSNAGIQTPPLLLKKGEGISSFSCGGMPISFVSFGEYDVCEFSLDPGDVFFLNTDGLIEQSNSSNREKIYGQERLIDTIYENKDLKPDQIIENIYLDFNNFKGEEIVQDDVTYLMLKHEELI